MNAAPKPAALPPPLATQSLQHPWPEDRESLPSNRLRHGEWPRITVITPSYNQGHFIEASIRSVLAQGYPNLEYIVIDGASSDETTDVLEYYSDYLDYWVSEPDAGQSAAINKGLAMATGEIINWINCDDLMPPNSLASIAENMGEADMLAGVTVNFRADGHVFPVVPQAITPRGLIVEPFEPGCIWHQPSMWLRRSRLMQLEAANEDLQYLFDFDLIIRYLQRFPKVRYLDRAVCYFRLHEASKTVSAADGFERERVTVMAGLRKRPEFAGLRAELVHAHHFLAWELARYAALTQRQRSRFLRAATIIGYMCLWPAVAWNEPARKALRRCLFKGGQDIAPRGPYQYE